MNVLLYFGLFNCLLIPAAVYMLWIKNHRFNFIETPLSYAGITETKRQFVFLTSLATLIELLFLIFILNVTNLVSNKILIVLAIVGFAGIFTTASTPFGKPRIHRAGIRIMITAMTFWSFYYHYLLLFISPVIAYIGFGLSVASFVGVLYLYFYIKSKGLTELFFITIVLFWNILMSYFLFMNVSV